MVAAFPIQLTFASTETSMMLLSLHIVAVAALIGISGSIGYQLGVKEGFRISSREKPPTQSNGNSAG